MTKKNMIRNLLIIWILSLCYGDSFSQSKYGPDSVSCVTNLSLFREYYKDTILLFPKCRSRMCTLGSSQAPPVFSSSRSRIDNHVQDDHQHAQ